MASGKELEHVKRQLEFEIEQVAPVGIPVPLIPHPKLRPDEQELWELLAEEGRGRYRPEDSPLLLQYVRAISCLLYTSPSPRD